MILVWNKTSPQYGNYSHVIHKVFVLAFLTDLDAAAKVQFLFEIYIVKPKASFHFKFSQTSFHRSTALSPFACALSIASVLHLSNSLFILEMQIKYNIQ